MKTAVIWNYCNGNIDYLVWEGDQTQFDQVYLGQAEGEDESDEILQRALEEFIYFITDDQYVKQGEERLKGLTTRKDFVQAILEGATLIECGELP